MRMMTCKEPLQPALPTLTKVVAAASCWTGPLTDDNGRVSAFTQSDISALVSEGLRQLQTWLQFHVSAVASSALAMWFLDSCQSLHTMSVCSGKAKAFRYGDRWAFRLGSRLNLPGTVSVSCQSM